MLLLCQIKSTHVTAQRTHEFRHLTLDGSHHSARKDPPAVWFCVAGWLLSQRQLPELRERGGKLRMDRNGG